jgi:LacI family transcriptional regulator
MSKRQAINRVALAVGYPSGFEDEIVQGAIDFAEHAGRWEFVGRGHRPFMPFEEIDLSSVDGVMGLLHPEMAEAVKRAEVAAVNCSTRTADLPLPRVGNDDEAIGRVGAEHLLSRGFAQYGFIHLPGAWYADRRLGAFRQTVEGDAGRPCHVLTLTDVHSDQLANWLAELPKPIALMAANDTTGRLAINAAVDGGFRIPEDVAVLGVDNDRWATAMSAVPLSSVAIDARQVGYRAARMLDELMAGQEPTPVQWISPTGVVTRHSTDIVVQQDPVVVEALRLMRDRCDEALHVDDVLDHLGVSRRTLEMKLKAAIGQTPQTAIYRARIERSKKLLVESDLALGEIARACGFVRQERFSVVFKRLIGLTPGRYRHQRGG